MKNLSCTALLTLMAVVSLGQCDESMQAAEKNLGENYITDTRFAQTLISGDDSLVVNYVWLANNTYRIATSPLDSRQMNIKAFDQNNNLIFDNAAFGYPSAWNFFIEHSMPVRCVFRLMDKPVTPVCFTVLTGFKK
jgi:hypothetical protein